MPASICHRCGNRVVCREFSEGKVTVITVSQIRESAFFCRQCRGLLCGACAGLAPSDTESSLMIGPHGFCPVCKSVAEPALEDQLTVAMSPQLRRASPKKGFLSRLFGQASRPANTLAYLFVITQHPEIADRREAAQYLVEVRQLCLQGADASYPETKLAAMWDTKSVDRAQLVHWASEAFGETFADLSTKYLLSFVRFEDKSGNGQVLIARNPG